jgi:TolB-like protein
MRFLILGLLLTIIAIPAWAQNPSADVVMVLPFENTSNRPEYNWVGESFADALAELLNKPGLIVVTSDERELAYQQLRLRKPTFRSRRV